MERRTTLAALLALPLLARAQADAPSEGEVRKIDKETGRLTLKHGELRNLDMPPMTMVFQVRDRAWLDRLKVGDRIRFRAEKDGEKYVVVALQPLP